jgi:hypothetical protein
VNRASARQEPAVVRANKEEFCYDRSPTARGTNPRAASLQTYARITDVVFLAALVVGGFGEAYAPSQLVVAGNATATAHNIVAHDLVLRLEFVGYLGEAITDVALTFLLYVLLRPVHANLAKLAVLFRIMATATFSFGELFYFAPSLILGGDGYLKTFSPEQLHTLALLSLNVYSAAGYLFIMHYGIASMILGYLMYRSGYLPRDLGVLWVLAGVGFVTQNVLWVLAPAYASPFLLLPQLLALLSLGLWLLVRGVDVGKWQEHEASASSARVPS